MPDLNQLRRQVYDLRLQINRLQDQINETTDGTRLEPLLAEMAKLQERLQSVEQNIAEQVILADSGVMAAATPAGPVTRGLRKVEPTALIKWKMSHIPTAIYHLLNATDNPLLECQINNLANESKKYRITSFIDKYSAKEIDTIDLERNAVGTVQQLPTLYPDQLHSLTELTRATVNVMVEDLNTNKVLTHITEPVWLLSRNSAPLEVRDPSTGSITDLSRYLGAFVTPNSPVVLKFLRTVAKHHPDGRLYGYQQEVQPQVKAIFDALKQDSQITYINSIVTFNAEENASTQRVRLPRECLLEQSANCIDGTLLFASLLEAASINPAIVIMPGHALVGWQNQAEQDDWSYLETMMIGTNSFAEALDIGNRKAKSNSAQALKNPTAFRRWSLRDLRTQYQITPLE